MARNKKPRKKYRPKSEANSKMRTRPEVVRRVFHPWDSLIEQLETDGTVYEMRGHAVYQDWEGRWYDMIPAADGFCEAFRMKQEKYGYDVEPMQKLVNRIRYNTPITEKELEPAKKALNDIRQAVMNMTVAEAQGLVLDAQIKFEMINEELEKEQS